MTSDDRGLWLVVLSRYLGMTGIGHFIWEILQLPLYTLWAEGTVSEIVFAVIHCTGGDILIALASLTVALIIVGNPGWPLARFREVAAMTMVFGVAYTLYSEWFNVSVRASWAYSPMMPTIPFFGAGLTPTLQWVVVPFAALAVAHRAVRRDS
jgi:hypothetical protein